MRIISLIVIFVALTGMAWKVIGPDQLKAISVSSAASPLLADRILGEASAPVTIIEYSSLTCPHCAEFNEKTFPRLKTDFIDTGKVRFISRDFPLDGTALKAAIIARCVPEDHYYPMIDLLFKSQENWVRALDPVTAITPLAKFAGLSEAQLKSCLADKKLEEGIVAERSLAETKYKVDSTPSFIFNDGATKLSGAQSYESFKTAIEKFPTNK